MVSVEEATVIGFLFFAFIHVMIVALRKARVKREAKSDDYLLQYGNGLRAFVIGVSLFWLVLFLVTTRGLRDVGDWSPGNFAIAAIAIAALIIPIWIAAAEAFGAAFVLSRRGIRKNSPWSPGLRIQWTEIEKVSHNALLQWITVKAPQGKIHFSDWLHGKEHLLRLPEELVPRERLKYSELA